MLRSFFVRSARTLLTHPRCCFAQDKFYVPIRPLKQERNVLYTIGEPVPVPFMHRLFTFTPLLAFILEGITYEWNALAWGGSLVGLYLAFRWNNMFMFNKSHECYEIAVNKNMTKYQFLVYNNIYSKKWEYALLQAQNKTYEQDFRQKLNNGTLVMPEEEIQRLKSYDSEQLSRAIDKIYTGRKGIYLEINQSQIKSFEFVSRRKLTQKIKTHYRQTLGRKVQTPVFQDYNTEKEERNILMIETKQIHHDTLLFFVYLENNLDKKLEEYLKALGEGKSIVTI